MKLTSSFEPHLVSRDLTLLPGGEWQPCPSNWLLVGVTAGMAYWIHLRGNQQLQAGSVLLLSSAAKGTIRSSQLAETTLRFFHVNPELLTGLTTVGEQRRLHFAASEESLAFRVFPVQSRFAEQFLRLGDPRTRNHLALRLQLFSLFVEALGTELGSASLDEPAPAASAKERLTEFLNRQPASELLKMEFTDLAKEMCCTPRHLSRIFRDVVGVSFRETQSEMRLNRARELLATTSAKVLDVALQSGYQSLSLFNLMFKRRFGMTPAKWRLRALRKPQRVSAKGRRRKSLRVAVF